MPAVVTLQRISQWMGRARAFEVRVDDIAVGKARNGESVRIPVTPGEHRLAVKLDWYTSKPLEIGLGPDQEIVVECGAEKGLEGVLSVFKSKGTYLYLRAVDQQPERRPEPVPTPQTAQAAVFMSYRRDDSSYVADRICEALSARLGAGSVFKDIDAIPLGADLREVIGNSVATCRVLLAIVGKEWLSVTDPNGRPRLDNAEDYVRIEIESALERNIPVIPVLVRGAAMPRADELPDSLAALAYRAGMLVRADPDFRSDIARLTEGIASDHPGVSGPPRPQIAD